MEQEQIALDGIILDIDYVNIEAKSIIRITLKQDGSVYTLYDPDFKPYFYLVPGNAELSKEAVSKVIVESDNEKISAYSVEETGISERGKEKKAFKIKTLNTRHVPKLSEALLELGSRYEYDILFWKRYLIDKSISPLNGTKIKAHKEGEMLLIDEIRSANVKELNLRHLSFDIETYNPLGTPRQEKDPIIMISYTDGRASRVLTTKKIDRGFVSVYKNEREMINAFSEFIKNEDVDAVVGYNSSNFDLPYLVKRASITKANFNIGRGGEEIRAEHHGLVDAVKIPGRANVDIYNVTKFLATVGASDKLIRANRLTLKEVYAAITGNEKQMVDRKNIWQIWDGTQEELEMLSDYSLGDSNALDELYRVFLPQEIEIARVTGTTLSEACISTTGQLVEYLLMRYAHNNNELVPNKPSEAEIERRNANPIEGAYVKTPDAGVYKDIAVFDFRSLYPSIIIAYNIDPSTLCGNDCREYLEAPNGIRFRKNPQGIVPKALRLLLKEREQIKKAYKEDPDNRYLGARSQALKILANSFYGYLGYARSRWYSRDCAGSVTALGRAYITKTMEEAEKSGFRVLYSDTDSLFILLGNRKREEALEFMKRYNTTLPETMELELEDFYASGVFVGKKGASGTDAGAKKKYALLSHSGRIKIKGFELVRRDWSNISRETQRMVLETILKEGGKENAILIVKDVVKRLREGKVELRDLVIRTQLRKKIDSYDAKSPELAAAKKAISKGARRKDELEGSTIGYVITKNGNSISEKAELEGIADNYDPDYYINHQVIPATLKILKELGVNEEELKGLGSQKRL